MNKETKPDLPPDGPVELELEEELRQALEAVAGEEGCSTAEFIHTVTAEMASEYRDAQRIERGQNVPRICQAPAQVCMGAACIVAGPRL